MRFNDFLILITVLLSLPLFFLSTFYFPLHFLPTARCPLPAISFAFVLDLSLQAAHCPLHAEKQLSVVSKYKSVKA